VAGSKSESRGKAPVASEDAKLSERRARAELKKLELETQELDDRVRRGRTWYRGRFLLQSIVGGAVAGALFVSWFIGVYSPRIELERERLQFRLESEGHNWELERREKDRVIRNHLDYLQTVQKTHQALAGWLKEHRVRLEGVADQPSENSDSRSTQVRFQFKKEISAMESIESAMANVLAEGLQSHDALQSTIDQLDNDKFKVEIVFSAGFDDLARQMAFALKSEGFMVRLSRWADFKEDGDGSMSRFFKVSPVLWFNKSHARTAEKSAGVRRALSTVLPPSEVVHEGSPVVVPGIGWSPPPSSHFQIWLFGNSGR